MDVSVIAEAAGIRVVFKGTLDDRVPLDVERSVRAELQAGRRIEFVMREDSSWTSV